MARLIADKDRCPCESDKLIMNCCLRRNGTLQPKPCVTKTLFPKTGIANPRCYASALADCSEKISREHFISHGILKALSDSDGVFVRGLSWQADDEGKKLPSNAIVGNILCERHNSALSALDSVAIRFFNKLDEINNEFRNTISGKDPKFFLVNGHDIERWMLKVLCGVVFSGNASSRIGVIKNWTPDTSWLNILFGRKPFPKNWGLYFSAQIGKESQVNRECQFAPISNAELGIYGAVMSLNAKEFIFVMTNPPADRRGTILEHALYRPTDLVMTDGEIERILMLGWDTAGVGHGVRIMYKKRG